MTPDASDDDRTVIRPPDPAAPTGFQKTEWSAANAAIPAAAPAATPAATPSPALDKTQIVAPPKDDGGHLPVGTMLAEFRLTELIGEGGFGVVYKAFDTSLEREVALKEYMPSSLAQRVGGGTQVQVKSERYRETFEAGRKSFIGEAKLLASFDHPSLVKVYRFWEANGTAYMVMPLLKGTTLKDVLREMRRKGEPIEENWLRSVLGPLSEALLVIHAEQVYHRDIAPDNVMYLPEKNRWLLLDFGAARRVISEQTQALTVILKPGYAPVEQYAEIPGMKQGPWTDVYALAAVVYYAIVGKTPPPSVGRLLNDTYQPLSQAAAGRYSERFLAAIDRALVVRPEERTQSIGELRQDLGLGEVSGLEDHYSTQPLPPGTEMPVRLTNDRTQAWAGGATQTVSAPPGAAAMRPSPAPPPAAAAASAPVPAAPKGKGALIGVGAGAAVAVAVGLYFALAPRPRPAPAEQATAPTPPPVATITPPVATPAPAPAPVAVPTTFEPAAEFDRVVQAQSPGYGVRLLTNKTSYRIARDYLTMTVQAEREGYLYVFVHGADKTLMQLYPSITSGSLKVRPGQSVKLPLSNETAFETTGPPGPTDLLVMVSPRQRDHSALQPKKDGTIRVFPTGAEAAALAAKFDGTGPVMAGKPLCSPGQACEDEYGAALVRVEVVP
ncbi:MAG: serine/threonine-protein kinase [Rubrivivax sp.]|nr:serine/threonine-protein kinase [Rubrivivax sp.]